MSNRGRPAKGKAKARHGPTVGSRVPDARATGLAFAATIRAAAPHQRERRGPSAFNGWGSSCLLVTPDDVREPIRRSKASQLLMFAVDGSGSMAARRRMAAVKGAVLSLLVDAYRRRYHVGLVVFRGERAEVLVRPTRSVDLAERLMRSMATGGRTPLADGLRLAGREIRRSSTRDPSIQPLLIVLSDGRANVGITGDPLADAHGVAKSISDSGVLSLVLDSEEGVVRLGLASKLGEALGATVLPIAALSADTIASTIRIEARRRA